LRLGTRVVREIQEESRNSVGRNLRLITCIILALGISLYSTSQSLSGMIRDSLPNLEMALIELPEIWQTEQRVEREFQHEVALAEKNGFVVPGGETMSEFLEFTTAQPCLKRVEQVLAFHHDNRLTERLNLSAEQTERIQKIALEAGAKMEQMWQSMQNRLDVFEEKLLLYLAEVETRILANLTPQQAQQWLQLPVV